MIVSSDRNMCYLGWRRDGDLSDSRSFELIVFSVFHSQLFQNAGEVSDRKRGAERK